MRVRVRTLWCALLVVLASTLIEGQPAPPNLFGPTVDLPQASRRAEVLSGVPAPLARRVTRPRLDLLAPRGAATLPSETPQRVTLDMLPGRAMVATRSRAERTASGGLVWTATIDGQPGATAVLSMNGSVLVGEVYVPNGDYYRIDASPTGETEIELGGWPSATDGDGVPAPVPLPQAVEPAVGARVEPVAPPSAATPDNAAVPTPAAAGTDDGSVVDLLVVFTAGARLRESSEAALRAKIDAAVAGANDAYARSQIPQRIRLVRAEEIAYTDTGDDNLDLSRLQTRTDGFLDSAHTLRDQYAADLVMLLTQSTGTGYFSGLAYVMSSLSTSFGQYGFSVCTGPLAFLFAHELAHNMGAAHGDTVSGGVFTYARGYTDSRTLSTVMGGQVPCASCTRLMQLSNPSVLYQGVPTGVVSVHDNARALTQSAPFVAQFRLAGALDGDGDTLPSTWESDFGLDPNASTGVNGAAGDPDGDGRTNAQELAAGTHPRGTTTRYFAEGAASTFFDTRIALANATTTSSIVLLRFLENDGTSTSQRVVVPARSRRTVTPASVVGTAEFSTIVESDVAVLVDRTMRWDASGYGSHAETALTATSTTWYLAEGATHSGFELFYLLQNPNPSTSAQVSIRYLLPSGAPRTQTYTVAPSSRQTIWVDRELSGALASTDVSAVVSVTNNVPIIVERAMYLSSGQTFSAGHESAGVTRASTNWYFAEGATGSYFDEFLLLANPDTRAADVRITYMLPTGATYTKSYPVAAGSRFNIWVDQEQFGGVARLADTAVAATVTSANGVPIVAERSMWWPGTAGTWQEAHNSPGSVAFGPRWGLADGEVGGPTNAETYVLVANTSTFAGSFRVTLLFEDGTAPVEKTFSAPANSRVNVNVSAEFPAARGRRFGSTVESVGSQAAQLVVERAMYSDAQGVHWAAGTHVVGSPLP